MIDRKIEKSKDIKDQVHRRVEIIQWSKENNGTENTTQKMKHWVPRTQLKTGVNSCSPEC